MLFCILWIDDQIQMNVARSSTKVAQNFGFFGYNGSEVRR